MNYADPNVFYKYFMSFYGPTGVYPEFIPGVTKAEIRLGITCRGDKFEGDTVDREWIRDRIIEARKGLKFRLDPLRLKVYSND